jgi:hypothetical protein
MPECDNQCDSKPKCLLISVKALFQFGINLYVNLLGKQIKINNTRILQSFHCHFSDKGTRSLLKQYPS